MKKWLISPMRCRYAQIFEMKTSTNNDGKYNATAFKTICTHHDRLNDEKIFYKCCQENCPSMDELEKL